MNFDDVVNRFSTNSTKWDAMESTWGVSAKDGIPMWIADMDFPAPDFLQNAAQNLLNTANYSYFCGMESFYEAVGWWMQTRHNWPVQPDWIFTTFGLGHAIATCLQAFTKPGDHIATFTPVYHEFQNKIEKTGRVNTQLPLKIDADGIYRMDFEAYEGLMTGKETLMLISSPHNPAGRVWTQDELTELADFCVRHDMLLIADEIHHDLVFEGHQHLATAVAIPQILDRMIITTAASKTFNIAGARNGCVIIPDDALRAKFTPFYKSFDISPNILGVTLTKAAYSPEGAAWNDALNGYLYDNYKLFEAELNSIPGVKLMPMESTYLSWVDFSGTGLAPQDVLDRVNKSARIAVTPGKSLGQGGESFLRFNLGTRRALVTEAAQRMKQAFADLG